MCSQSEGRGDEEPEKRMMSAMHDCIITRFPRNSFPRSLETPAGIDERRDGNCVCHSLIPQVLSLSLFP